MSSGAHAHALLAHCLWLGALVDRSCSSERASARWIRDRPVRVPKTQLRGPPYTLLPHFAMSPSLATSGCLCRLWAPSEIPFLTACRVILVACKIARRVTGGEEGSTDEAVLGMRSCS